MKTIAGMKVIAIILFLILSLFPVLEAHGAGEMAAAQSEMDAGRLKEAVHILDVRLSRRPRDVKALRMRALAHCGLGDYDSAVQDYESILVKKPKAAAVHRDLGMLLAFKVKDSRHALFHLDRFLSLQGDSALAERAARVMKMLEGKLSPRERRISEDLLEMAADLKSKGQLQLAMDIYRRILEIRPSCVACHESLGAILLEENKRSAAEIYFAKARLFGRVDKI